jgi:hypothetical protein
MGLQRGEIVERIGARALAGINEAHEQVGDMSAALRLEVEGRLAVEVRFLERPLGDIVLLRGPRRAGTG